MRLKHKRSRKIQVKRTIFFFLACSVLVAVGMLKYALERHSAGTAEYIPASRLRGGRKNSWVSPDARPFNDKSVASEADHLVMVAGHSVTVAGNLEDAETDENVWYLLPYQKERGLPQAIVSHIRAGISEASDDPKSLLIFSGGETRGFVGPLNEGTSYFRVADALDLWNEPGNGGLSTVRERTSTEEFATDSFQNLMFSICRFKEVTGSYPRKITVVSFSFKERRFGMHAGALQWPASRMRYVGIDPPSSTGFDLKESLQGELNNAAKPFENDPYGCSASVLQEKRRLRNPFARTPPYQLTCPEMKSLLQWCGPGLFPKNQVPWANA